MTTQPNIGICIKNHIERVFNFGQICMLLRFSTITFRRFARAISITFWRFLDRQMGTAKKWFGSYDPKCDN